MEEISSFRVDPVINIPDRKFGLFKRRDAGESGHQKFIVAHEAVHDLPNPARRITFSRDACIPMNGEQEDTGNSLRLCSMSSVRAIATCVNDLWGVSVVLSMIHSSRLLQTFAFPPLLLFRSSFRNQWVFHRVILSFPFSSRWPLGVIYCFPCELSFCLVPSCRRRPSASQRKHLITPSHNS